MAKIGAIHYNWPGCDLEGFARRASEIGYRYCELQIGDIWDGESKNGEQTAAATRELLAKYGMHTSAVAAGNDFLQANPRDLDAQIERYRYVCQIIPITGTDIVRSDGGWNRNGDVQRTSGTPCCSKPSSAAPTFWRSTTCGSPSTTTEFPPTTATGS